VPFHATSSRVVVNTCSSLVTKPLPATTVPSVPAEWWTPRRSRTGGSRAPRCPRVVQKHAVVVGDEGVVADDGAVDLLEQDAVPALAAVRDRGVVDNSIDSLTISAYPTSFSKATLSARRLSSEYM